MDEPAAIELGAIADLGASGDARNASHLVEEELIEEISIDGMCGVY